MRLKIALLLLFPPCLVMGMTPWAYVYQLSVPAAQFEPGLAVRLLLCQIVAGGVGVALQCLLVLRIIRDRDSS